MNNIKQLFIKFEQFLRFSLIGIINSVIAFIVNAITVYELTNRITNKDMLALTAAVIAFIISSANGYIWNRFWVFNKARTKNSLSKFYVTYTSTFLFGLITTFICSHNGFNLYWIPVPTMAVTFMVNFFLSKYWAFRHHE